MKKKRLIRLLFIFVMTAAMLADCGSRTEIPGH